MIAQLPILGATAAGETMTVDVDALIGSHACIVANSGGGKSGLIRRLLEVTHGRIQHVVLDIEDEFYTLRERFDYVIAGGDGGDAPATPASAPGLARLALEHGFSLIAQINDLGDDAPAFVAAFLDSLMSAPRHLWRPLLVVIDETQRFAPVSGSTEATDAVKSLVQRGRKRGFTGIFASLALSEINPRVRGLVNNWLLGRVGQALDRDTMARQLGFRPSSAEAIGLQKLAPRTFWGFGPAFSPMPTLFRVADVETTPVRPGQAKVPTPPAPEALRAILQGLQAPAGDRSADAPAEAAPIGGDAKVQQRLDDLARRNWQLVGERDELQAEVERLERGQLEARNLIASITRLLAELLGWKVEEPDLHPADADSHENAGNAEENLPSPPRQPRAGVGEARAGPPRSTSASPEPGPAAGADALRGRKALAALLQHSTGRTERQWAWVAGFSIKGGTWGTYKSALRAAGLVEERDGKWWPTAAALRLELGEEQRFPMLGPELVRSWKGKIPGVGRMVDELLKLWPEWTLRANLADRLNMAADGGTFGTYLSRLRSAALIEQQGKKVRLNPEAMEAAHG